MGAYERDIKELAAIQEQIRTIRHRVCDEKSNNNPRYLGLSNAVAGINKAVVDMRAEDTA